MATLARRLRHNKLFELVFTVALAIGLAICVQAYAVKPYRIPSGSMEPTLAIGQRVLVDRFSHRLGASPSVGDVVVFHPPIGADDEICGSRSTGVGTKAPCAVPARPADRQNFIKRVVAIGGDRVAVVDGHVIRNGRRQNEPYAAPCGGGPDCDFPHPIVVPHGYVFLMGDNRGASDDSRFWGPVPVSWVVGQAFASYWPPSRIGTL